MRTSLRKVAAVLRREYLVRVRNRWFLIVTLGLPVLMVGFALLPAWLSARTADEETMLRVGIAEREGIEASALAQRLRETDARFEPLVARVPPETGREAMVDSLRASNLDAYLVIRSPAGDSAPARATLVSLRSVSPRQNRVLRSAVREALLEAGLRRFGVQPESLEPLVRTTRASLDVVRVQETGGVRSQEVLAGVAMTLNFILYMMFLIYGQVIARGVVEEKSSDIVEILLSSLRPWEMMAGKIVGIGAVGLTQIAIWTLAGVLLGLYGLAGAAGRLAELGVDLASVSIPLASVGTAFLVFFVLGFLLYASGFAAVGALMGDEQGIQNANFPLVLLIVTPFILAFPAIDAPHAAWLLPASLFPFFSPILMVLRITMGVAATWEVLAAVLLLLVTIAGTAWLAGRIYRIGILMRGKRPNLPELIRWLRYG